MEKKIIDMHAHCLINADFKSEYCWYSNDYYKKFNDLSKIIAEKNIEKCLVYILDPKAVAMKKKNYNNLSFALMIDFRSKEVEETVRRAKKAGFLGVKILTYEQKVTETDYSKIWKMAREIEKQNMFLTVCSTFGTVNPKRHDALALVSYLLERGFKERLVLAHAGGSRIKEAILIADSAPNVYLETSFTSSYWAGTDVIDDIIIAIKKFPERVFYGSDGPNISFDQAKKDSMVIARGLKKNLQYNFFYNNANNFLKFYE